MLDDVGIGAVGITVARLHRLFQILAQETVCVARLGEDVFLDGLHLVHILAIGIGAGCNLRTQRNELVIVIGYGSGAVGVAETSQEGAELLDERSLGHGIKINALHLGHVVVALLYQVTVVH